ncbi:MAG: preprotein translocase subunit SecG, partial [Rudaea sp.]
MILNLFNIVYVLVAIAMIALILLQRGSGADAGSGFGGGASATVFGARGATTFLSRSTAVLAALFFLLSLTMAWYLGNAGNAKPADDLGVMSGVEVPAAHGAAATTPAKGDV